MVTIYNYAFTILRDCVVTVFELLNHIHNKYICLKRIFFKILNINDKVLKVRISIVILSLSLFYLFLSI